jgi:hypothetical protein
MYEKQKIINNYINNNPNSDLTQQNINSLLAFRESFIISYLSNNGDRLQIGKLFRQSKSNVFSFKCLIYQHN